MNTVKIADLKNNLSRHLARVRQGAEITVLDRATPVARLVPYVAAWETKRDAAARVDDLVRRGVVSPGDSRAVARWLARHRPIKVPAGSPSAVDVLLTMRRESRR